MGQVQPMYLAVDTSASMGGDRLAAVEQAIVHLQNELLSNPLLGEMVRVGIIGFSDHAEVVQPLSDLTELTRLPRLRTRGAAQYGPLFDLLGRVVERDIRVLRVRRHPGEPAAGLPDHRQPTG